MTLHVWRPNDPADPEDGERLAEVTVSGLSHEIADGSVSTGTSPICFAVHASTQGKLYSVYRRLPASPEVNCYDLGPAPIHIQPVDVPDPWNEDPITVTWETDHAPYGFAVEVVRDGDVIIAEQLGAGERSFSFATDPESSYEVTVWALDEDGNPTSVSDSIAFTTGFHCPEPAVATGLSPGDEGTSSDDPSTIDSSESIGTDGGEFTMYFGPHEDRLYGYMEIIQFVPSTRCIPAGGGNVSTVFEWVEVLRNEGYLPVELQPIQNRMYAWRVRSENACGDIGQYTNYYWFNTCLGDPWCGEAFCQ